jgi:hypothetical protein
MVTKAEKYIKDFNDLELKSSFYVQNGNIQMAGITTAGRCFLSDEVELTEGEALDLAAWILDMFSERD